LLVISAKQKLGLSRSGFFKTDIELLQIDYLYCYCPVIQYFTKLTGWLVTSWLVTSWLVEK